MSTSLALTCHRHLLILTRQASVKFLTNTNKQKQTQKVLNIPIIINSNDNSTFILYNNNTNSNSKSSNSSGKSIQPVGIIAFYLSIATPFDILFLFRTVEPMVVLKQPLIANEFLFCAFDLHCTLPQRAPNGTANSGVIGLSFNTTMDISAIATRIGNVLGFEPNSINTTEIQMVETDTTLTIKRLFLFRTINPIVMFKQQQQIDNESVSQIHGSGSHCVLKQREQIVFAQQCESYNARQGRLLLPSKGGRRLGGDTRGEYVIAQENQLANGFEKAMGQVITFYNAIITISFFALVFFTLMFCSLMTVTLI